MGRLIKMGKPSRLRKRIIKAEWQSVDTGSSDLVQIITDNMAAGTQIQVEYEGSGWRLIQPYGWNTSKQGNVLLMCYKDTGEIRSYRLDRILQVLVDSNASTNIPVDTITDPGSMYEVKDYNANPDDFQIPELPNMDEILDISEKEQGQELPYDVGIDYLTNKEPIPEEESVVQPIEDEPEKNIEEDKLEEDKKEIEKL